MRGKCLYGFDKTCPNNKINFYELMKNIEMFYPTKMRNAHTFIYYTKVIKNKGHISMKFLIMQLRKKTQSYKYVNTL